MPGLEDYLSLPEYEVRYYQIFQKSWVTSIESGPFHQIKSFYETLQDCGVIRSLEITEVYDEGVA